MCTILPPYILTNEYKLKEVACMSWSHSVLQPDFEYVYLSKCFVCSLCHKKHHNTPDTNKDHLLRFLFLELSVCNYVPYC